jgi:peptidoglycan/xylan/chitin deacetylase (PgdA/CDA1 family)
MPTTRILTFHGIGAPARVLESGEAPFWMGTGQFVDILDRIARRPDRASLAITFDDSNSSDLSIAAPQLLSRGLRATFFVLTGRIGQRGSLNAFEIRELIRAGMRIGSHGVDHRDWTQLTCAELWHDLVASKRSLFEICGHPIESAAIPFGRYNAAALRALWSAGYRKVYSSDRGLAKPSAFLQPRTSIRADTTDPELEQILAGRLNALRWMRRGLSMRVKRLS